jgi:hypothetical protein
MHTQACWHTQDFVFDHFKKTFLIIELIDHFLVIFNKKKLGAHLRTGIGGVRVHNTGTTSCVCV